MPAVQDDLEKLLGDVRKTISDNEHFLKALVEDAVDVSGEADGSEEEAAEEEFEEL